MNVRKTLLITAKSFFQPPFELTKKESEVSSGRLLEKFDNARTQVLPRVHQLFRTDAHWSRDSRPACD